MPGYEPGVQSEPRWLRLTGLCDRLYRAFGALREELALACVAPWRWRSIAAERYGRQVGPYGDGAYLRSGLFDWERSAVEAFFPRAPARVLVGGAGAGREMLALAALGYRVAVFEPSPPLHAALARHAAGLDPPVEAVRGDYETLVAAVESRAEREPGSALDELASARYDAVLLGFGSISHVAQADLRVKLFAALARLCPAGPVLLSFEPAQPAAGRIAALARIARRLLSRLPGAHPVSDGDRLGPFGFEHAYSDDEIRALAEAAGYRVARLVHEPYAHATIVRAQPPAA
jgi:hypothetical protein